MSCTLRCVPRAATVRRAVAAVLVIAAASWAQTQSPTIEALVVKRNPTCSGGLRDGMPCLTDCDCPGIGGACGGDITPTSDIVINPGDVIVTEFFASEWSPKGERLRSIQVEVDLSELATGDSGEIRIVTGDRCCDSNADCTDLFPTAVCRAGACTAGPSDPPLRPEGAGIFVEVDRDDYVFRLINTIRALDLTGVQFGFIRYAAVVFNASQTQAYVPPRRYLATLALVVSDDASGAFRVRLEPNNFATGLFDNGSPSQPILPLTVVSATITVVPAVCGNGFCETGEDDVSCPVDCLVTVCGNGTCEFDEDDVSCPVDCLVTVCGNGICEFDEDDVSCPVDCLVTVCGNGTCEFDEDDVSCPADCFVPVCGNGSCETGEDTASCRADCPPVDVPALSGWGVAILLLILLSAAKVGFRRPASPGSCKT